MGVARHREIDTCLCALDDGFGQFENCPIHPIAGAHHPQAKVGRYLVVPTAAGVQLARHRSNALREQTLNGRMDVFVRCKRLKCRIG